MRNLNLFKLSVTFLLFVSCNYGQNCNKEYVSNYLIDYTLERDYDYCKLLNESLNEDIIAIKKISLLKFYDGMTYEHGAVLLEIIDNVGEKKYLEAIRSLSSDEKVIIKSYLYAGLDFTQNTRFKDKKLKDTLNEIYNYFDRN